MNHVNYFFLFTLAAGLIIHSYFVECTNRSEHNLTVISAKRNQLPKDVSSLPFGTVFTDHMFIMEWTEEKGWHNPRIEPYAPFTMSPASIHMHYGMEIFEGMKAYKTVNGRIVLFRPEDHIVRMNRSAKRLCMPEVDTAFVIKALKRLIAQDKQWVPDQPDTALYIRPTMIATETTINLKPSNRFLFFIIMSPVGSLYQQGFNPVSIVVAEHYTRASVGGVGAAKTGGNYAASMLAQKEAKERGFAQVLWLDPVERKYVEEVGTMNIFFVINNQLVTPELNGTILAGITRKSVIELAQSMGIRVVERKISIDEVVQAIAGGTCTEIFGTGTAAVISPVGSLGYKGKTYTVNNNQTGPITTQLYKTLTGIQRNAVKMEFKWIESVE